MKGNYFLILILLLAQSAAASAFPRNPFQQLVPPCQSLFQQLDRWSLHGVISTQQGAIAIVRDPQKAWWRVRRGIQIEPDVQIIEIEPQKLTVEMPAECGPALYSWVIKRKEHGMDTHDDFTGHVAADKPRGEGNDAGAG